MSAIYERGGIRWAIEGDYFVVYIDADELADVDEIDVPEVAVLRVSRKQIGKAGGKAWGDIKAEVRRAVKNTKAELKRAKRRLSGSKRVPK